MALRQDGSLAVSRTDPGRGAWLCREPESGAPAAGCVGAALARRAFSRAYRTEVSAEASAALRDSLAERAIMDRGAMEGAENVENDEKGLKQ